MPKKEITINVKVSRWFSIYIKTLSLFYFLMSMLGFSIEPDFDKIRYRLKKSIYIEPVKT
jgi:hypothetical protein